MVDMKLYYFQYADPQGVIKTEAFTSMTTARKKMSDLKKITNEQKKAMQNYVIGGKRGERPPNYIRELPIDIKTVEFQRDSQGMLEAFTFLANKE